MGQAQAGLGGLATDRADNLEGVTGKDGEGLATETHCSAAGSASGCRLQVAFHSYSTTWPGTPGRKALYVFFRHGPYGRRYAQP